MARRVRPCRQGKDATTPTPSIELPGSERRRAVPDAFATTRNVPGETDGESTTAGDVAAIGESLEDEAAGRVIDGDIARRQIRERLGWQRNAGQASGDVDEGE